MTPGILEAMKWFPDNRRDSPPPYEFTWIDLGFMDFGRYHAIANRFNNGEIPVVFHTPTLPQDVPMPFEMLGIVVTAPPTGKDEKETLLAVTFHRNGNDMQVIFRHPTKRELILTQVGERSIQGNQDLWFDGEMINALKLAPKYKDKTEAQIVDDFVDMARQTYAQMYVSLMDKGKNASTPMYAATPNPANEKRIRKGKRPLFEWKVIDVTARHIAPEGEGKTGRTHASPRRHVRRGHHRKLASGKVVWVKQMWVGKIEFGYIHHSYTAGENSK